MKPEPMSDYGMQTRLIHGADAANDTTALTPPIYQTSTFAMPSPEAGAALASAIAPETFYTRYGSPNQKHASVLLSALEGGEAALVVGSGMAAVTLAIMANVQAGDHVVAQRTHYTSAMTLLMETLPAYGIEVTQVDQTDTGAFERAMRPQTKVVYTESPTNPTQTLTDLAATAAIAHAGNSLAITDNTFATPVNQHPLALGYDLALHSATKYLNGHADVTAGALVGSQALIDRAWERSKVFGAVLHPFEAWLLRRGLMTLPLRMAAHNRNALEVAAFLEGHPAVARVFYPGLASHPQHELARRQMPGGFGGMLSFTVKGGFEAAYRAIGRTHVCRLAVSLGGLETLITHPASMIHTHQSDADRASSGIEPDLIRLSVGVEDARDIIRDLDEALS